MSNDVSGFGIRVQLVASSTFPSGISLSQFADDADPFDIPSVNIGDTAMGVNGDLVKWNKANPIKITINVIPGSDDDLNLAVLLEANRVGRGKTSAQDDIDVTAVYPDGSVATLSGGMITDGMFAASVASSGRQKSKAYQFHFEGFARA
jgi:hypothetical protein